MIATRTARIAGLTGLATLLASAAYAVDVPVAPEPLDVPAASAPSAEPTPPAAEPPAPVSVPTAPSAGGNYIDLATQHCRAWLSNGSADMSFALGKAVAEFSQAELTRFNQAFGGKLRDHYGIGNITECTLKEVNESPVISQPNKPPEPRDRAPHGLRTVAVVSGTLPGEDGVPVAVAYRLEQGDTGAPWRIRSISLNGEPLVDRWREEYEALAKSDGAEAVLTKVAQQ